MPQNNNFSQKKNNNNDDDKNENTTRSRWPKSPHSSWSASTSQEKKPLLNEIDETTFYDAFFMEDFPQNQLIIDSADSQPQRKDQKLDHPDYLDLDDSIGPQTRYQRFKDFFWPRFRYYIPIVPTLINYKPKDTLIKDISAGITIAVMVIPQGLTFSFLVGVDPIYGLYAAFMPLIIYGLFGTSRQLAIGPEAMIAILVGINAQEVAHSLNCDESSCPELSSAEVVDIVQQMSILTGLFTLVLGLARFGFIEYLLSRPVLKGFITAVAFLIAISQLDVILGLDFPDQKGLSKIPKVAKHIHESNWPSILISVLSLGIQWGIQALKKRYRERFRWIVFIPEILIVVFLGILISFTANLKKTAKVAVLGSNSGEFPVPTWPHFTTESMTLLAEPAAVIAIVGFVESVIVARKYATEHNYQVSSNRELVALGLANVCGGFFRSWPVFGSIPRSQVNNRAGATSVIAGLVTALTVMVSFLVLLPVFAPLPKPIMASIIIVAGLGLLEFEEYQFLFHIRAWKDIGLSFVVFVATLINVELGLVIAIGISLIFVVKYSSMPTVAIRGRTDDSTKLEDHQEFKDINLFSRKHKWFRAANFISQKGILVLRIEEPLYFVNIGSVKSLLWKIENMSTTQLNAVILDLRNVSYLDSSAVQGLIELIEEYHSRDIQVCFVKLRGNNKELLFRSGLMDLIGPQNLFGKTKDALHTIENGPTKAYSTYL